VRCLVVTQDFLDECRVIGGFEVFGAVLLEIEQRLGKDVEVFAVNNKGGLAHLYFSVLV